MLILLSTATKGAHKCRGSAGSSANMASSRTASQERAFLAALRSICQTATTVRARTARRSRPWTLPRPRSAGRVLLVEAEPRRLDRHRLAHPRACDGRRRRGAADHGLARAVDRVTSLAVGVASFECPMRVEDSFATSTTVLATLIRLLVDSTRRGLLRTRSRWARALGHRP